VSESCKKAGVALSTAFGLLTFAALSLGLWRAYHDSLRQHQLGARAAATRRAVERLGGMVETEGPRGEWIVTVVLRDATVTDEWLRGRLAGSECDRLRELDVRGTEIGPETVEWIQRRFPNVRIAIDRRQEGRANARKSD
jgi:hypothetical protein